MARKRKRSNTVTRTTPPPTRVQRARPAIPAPRHHGLPTFFILPAELRLEVYKHALLPASAEPIRLNDARPRSNKPEFNLLRTCHFIRDEAIPTLATFYSTYTFRVDILDLYIGNHKHLFEPPDLAALEKEGDNPGQARSLETPAMFHTDKTRPGLWAQLRKIAPRHLMRIRHWEFAYHKMSWYWTGTDLEVPGAVQRVLFPNTPPKCTVRLELLHAKPWYHFWACCMYDPADAASEARAGRRVNEVERRFKTDCDATIWLLRMKSLAPIEVMGLAYCVERICHDLGPGLPGVVKRSRRAL